MVNIYYLYINLQFLFKTKYKKINQPHNYYPVFILYMYQVEMTVLNIKQS